MALLLATWGPTAEGEWRRMVDDLTIAPGDVVDDWRSDTGELRIARGAPMREASDRSPIVSRAHCTMVIDGWIDDIEQRGSAAAEVALDAYLRSGPRFASSLEGEFSFLLHDGAARVLFAGCDAAGARAPAWFCDGHVMVVASRAVTILKHSAAPLRWNQRYLAHMVSEIMSMPAELTAFEHVRRIVPGATLRFELSPRGVHAGIAFRDALTATPLPTEQSHIEELLLQTIDAATAKRLGTARIALALSGGLDSAVVATSLRQTGRSLDAWALVDGRHASEADSMLAAILGRVREIRLHRIPAEEAYGFGERGPLTDDPVIAGPAMQVARNLLYRTAAKAGVERVFNGEGGDELFDIAWRSPRALRHLGVVAVLRDLVFGHRRRQIVARIAEAANLPQAVRRSVLIPQMRRFVSARPWLTRSFLGSDALGMTYDDCLAASAADVGPHRIRLVLDAMQRNYTAQSLAHAAAGLEQASPLLDRRVSRLVSGLSVAVAGQGTGTKPFFRQAARLRLPRSVVDQTKVEELDAFLCVRALGPTIAAEIEGLRECAPLCDLIDTDGLEEALRRVDALSPYERNRAYRLTYLSSWARRVHQR
jgi:prepilin-type processing-associated H-X9-DG protein